MLNKYVFRVLPQAPAVVLCSHNTAECLSWSIFQVQRNILVTQVSGAGTFSKSRTTSHGSLDLPLGPVSFVWP